RFDTRASELALGIREFAMNHGIRGLNADAADQCCKRITFYRMGKSCVEPKRGSKGRTDSSGRAVKGFKERLGYSPDHHDSWSILIEHCRLKGANVNEGTIAEKSKPNEQWDRDVRKADELYREDAYLQSPEYPIYDVA